MDDESVTFTLRVPAHIQAAAKAQAKREYVSLNGWVVRLMEAELRRKADEAQEKEDWRPSVLN
ncbi:YlcI/YnfO family protein [Comamonas sp. MYb396]|uniref:YlcI/YnfO family protein n=1 Tax=Comamonas sp. MYb396 TaxID=2745302 RepID=UPI0030B2C33A